MMSKQLFTEKRIYHADGLIQRIERRSTSDNTMIIYYYVLGTIYCTLQYIDNKNISDRLIRHGCSHWWQESGFYLEHLSTCFHDMDRLEGEVLNFK